MYLAKNSKSVPDFKKKKVFHKKSKAKINLNVKPKHDEKMKRRGKHGSKKNMSKVKCFNCQKFGHFAKDCNELKRVLNAEKIVDAGTTYLVIYDRGMFVEYYKISIDSRWLYFGNNTEAEV
ncbi:unnamed protein product [Victoria cruziana]